MIYRFDTGNKPLKEIAHADICVGAAFRLDIPMNITPEDEFLLEDGVWYLLEGKERRQIQGRWCSPKIEAVPEKPQTHRVHPVVVNLEDE